MSSLPPVDYAGLRVERVEIYPILPAPPVLAKCSILLSCGLAIHEVSVIEAAGGRLIIAYPGLRKPGGGWSSFVHPVNHEVGGIIRDAVLAALEDQAPAS